MILYREKDLDAAYKIDCKARTRNNMPWIKREDFRTIYEDLMDLYMIQLSPKQLLEVEEIPEEGSEAADASGEAYFSLRK